MMNTHVRWNSQDVELLPDKNVTYEIIDGELFVAKQPHWHHPMTCTQILAQLHAGANGRGMVAPPWHPGVIFDDENDVAPDVVWVTREQFELSSPLLPGFCMKVAQCCP